MSSVGDQSHLPRGLPLPPTSSKDTRPNKALREASTPSGFDPTHSTRAGAAPPPPNMQSRNCVSRGPASSDKTVITTSIQKSKFPSSPPPSPPTSPGRPSLLRQSPEAPSRLHENSFTYIGTSAQSRPNIPSGPAEQSNPRAALKEADKLGTFAKITRTVSEFFKPPQKDLQRQNSAPGTVETREFQKSSIETREFQKSSITTIINEPITISEFFNQNSLKNEQKALEMIVKTLDSTIDKGGQTYKPIELSYEGVKGSLIEFGAAIASITDAVLQSKDLSIDEKHQLLEQLPNLNIDIKGSDGRSAQMTINTAYGMLSRKFEENLSTRLKQLSTEVAILRSEGKNKQANELILQMKSIKTSKLTSDANPANITQFKLKENEITNVVKNIPQPSLDEIKGELENVLLENRNLIQFFNSIGINTPQAQEHLVGLLYKGQDELTDFVSELKKQILSQNINSEMLKEKLNLQNLMRNNSFAEGMFEQPFAGPSSSTARPAPQPIASSSTQSSANIKKQPSRLASLRNKFSKRSVRQSDNSIPSARPSSNKSSLQSEQIIQLTTTLQQLTSNKDLSNTEENFKNLKQDLQQLNQLADNLFRQLKNKNLYDYENAELVKISNLIRNSARDIKRPLGDIKNNINFEDIKQIAQKILDKLPDVGVAVALHNQTQIVEKVKPVYIEISKVYENISKTEFAVTDDFITRINDIGEKTTMNFSEFLDVLNYDKAIVDNMNEKTIPNYLNAIKDLKNETEVNDFISKASLRGINEGSETQFDKFITYSTTYLSKLEIDNKELSDLKNELNGMLDGFGKLIVKNDPNNGSLYKLQVSGKIDLAHYFSKLNEFVIVYNDFQKNSNFRQSSQTVPFSSSGGRVPEPSSSGPPRSAAQPSSSSSNEPITGPNTNPITHK